MKSKLLAGMVVVAVCACVASTQAAVIKAVHEDAIHLPGNYLFYAFGFDPALDHIYTVTSSSNKSLNFIEIVDDTVNDGNGPWLVNSSMVMDVTQMLDFGKDGAPLAIGGDYTTWGLKFSPATNRYYFTCFAGQLKNPDGSISDQYCIVGMLDPDLPNGTDAAISTNGLPSGALYDASASFASSGVVPGDQVTIVSIPGVTSGTYVVTQVLDENTIQLDRDPGHGEGVVYYMKLQRWITQADFRALDPVAFENPTAYPNCGAPPGVSPDGNTLYFRDSRTSSVVQCSTATPGSLSFFVTNATLLDYVTAQVNLGRTKAVSGEAFSPAGTKVMSEIATDRLGRVWFSEIETDDILWTADGVTLNTFLTSNDMYAFFVSQGLSTAAGSGSYVNGVLVDKMGTVYWSDVSTHAIHKCPAIGGIANMRLLATGAEVLALGPTTNTGLTHMTQRGTQLLCLTYGVGSSAKPGYLLAVDMKTWQYGDFDEDIDNDLVDYARFQQCLGAPIAGDPEHPCNVCDVDSDEDVDLDDYVESAKYATGPL